MHTLDENLDNDKYVKENIKWDGVVYEKEANTAVFFYSSRIHLSAAGGQHQWRSKKPAAFLVMKVSNHLASCFECGH